MGRRAGLWVVLCLVGGGASAFLALEGVGIPYALVFLAGLTFLSLRLDLLAESLGAVGLAFTGVAARFAIPWIVQRDLATAGYFYGVIALGIAFVVVAIAIRRPNRWFRR